SDELAYNRRRYWRPRRKTVSMTEEQPRYLDSQEHDVTSQHWSYSSERYAGGDNLLTAIARGWAIDKVVTLRRHWFAGMRCIEIFHFTIRRDDVVADMAVLGNPYVYRYLANQPHELVEAEDGAVA
ncbi:MAG: hypothetical protein OXI30_03495, partial [Chloroflexota bacterium]|nr:hypothetical protein [Chloroflexota bacterium]